MSARANPFRAVEDVPPVVLAETTDLTVEEAAATGDQRLLLLALRNRVSAAVADPKCPPRDLAALSRRLQDIASELEAMRVAAEREENVDHGSTQAEAWDSSAI